MEMSTGVSLLRTAQSLLTGRTIYLPVFSHLTCIFMPSAEPIFKSTPSPVFSHLPRILLSSDAHVCISLYCYYFSLLYKLGGGGGGVGLNNRIKYTCASTTIGIKCAQTLIFYLLRLLNFVYCVSSAGPFKTCI